MTGFRISLDGLCAARGGAVIVGPLALALAGGEALAVTGPNGAGKSTLLRVLAGLLPPAGGRIHLEGAGEARALGEIAHYLGHRNALKPGLTLAANLGFWHGFLAAGGGPGETVAAALEAVGLGRLADVPAAYLSAGQARRAALARLLLAHRFVWLLDEPTAALDAAAQAQFAALAAAHLTRGGLLIAATHQPLGIPARHLELSPAAPPDGRASLDAAERRALDAWQ